MGLPEGYSREYLKKNIAKGKRPNGESSNQQLNNEKN